MNISVPNSWEELTPYQQRELIHIISNVKGADFMEEYIRIVKVLLMKKNNIWHWLRMRWILRNIPISAFQEAVDFLTKPPTLHTFPKIKGLVAPADRLGDISIEQFSLCDTILHRYYKEKNEKQRKVYQRQLVAVLYRLPAEVPTFDKGKLPQIARISDKIPEKEAQRIVFIFTSIMQYITSVYPKIFKSPKNENQPQFAPKHTPFSQIITMMAADELRLLGNLKECQNTLVYDFFNALLESKRIHEIKAKALKK